VTLSSDSDSDCYGRDTHGTGVGRGQFPSPDIKQYRGLGPPQVYLDGRKTIGMTLQRLTEEIDGGGVSRKKRRKSRPMTRSGIVPPRARTPDRSIDEGDDEPARPGVRAHGSAGDRVVLLD
jgi:hypothetical protein